MWSVRALARGLVLGLLAATAAGQPHGTDILVGTGGLGNAGGYLCRVTPGGAVTTLGQYAAGSLSGVPELIMDTDNRHVVVVSSPFMQQIGQISEPLLFVLRHGPTIR